LKILFYSQGFLMPLMRCTEPAFIVLIKRRIKQNLFMLTCGKWRLEQELKESLEDRLNYRRLESGFSAEEIEQETPLVTDKIDEELKLRSKLSAQNN
jgi:hypothetical protein